MELADLGYLEKGFDPSTLKVADLRRILTLHEVDFKSSAKKAELVEYFNEHVSPNTDSYLAKQINPGRARNVIEDASKTPAKTPAKTPRRKLPHKHAIGSDEDELTGPESTTVTKSVGRPRKSAKLDDEVRIPVTLKKSTSPRKSMRMEVDDDEPPTIKRSPRKSVKMETSDDDAPPTIKRSPRKSTKMETTDDKAMPVAKPSPRKSIKPTPRKISVRISPKKTKVTDSEADEDMTDASEVQDRKQDAKQDAAFSSENPFQSGSPNLHGGSTKRRQTSIMSSAPKLAPPSNRRQTEMAPALAHHNAGSVRSAKTPVAKERFMPPIGSLLASPAFQSAAQRAKENALAEDQLLTTEEFTPEEAATLDRPRTQDEPGAVLKMLKFLSISALTASTLYGAGWYRREQIAAGWCDIDSKPFMPPPHATSFQDFIQQVRPNCLPCPPHAICSPGFRMSCEDEFTKMEHPLSFGGLLPLSPQCVPDTEKLRKIQVVANEIVETMRDRAAAVECGYATPTETLMMTDMDLYSALLSKKSATMSNEQFDALFAPALKDAIARDEVEVSSSQPQGEPTYEGLGEVDHHITHYYHSTSLANLPFTCSIKRSFRRVVARYRLEATGLLAFLLGVLYLKHFFESRNVLRARVAQLVALVYEELLVAKAKSIDNERFEPHLGVSQLRDAVLQDEFSYKERERLWHEVGKVVEANSNVRATQAEIQGEWLRAWEWVGAVKGLEKFGERQPVVDDLAPNEMSGSCQPAHDAFAGAAPETNFDLPSTRPVYLIYRRPCCSSSSQVNPLNVHSRHAIGIPRNSAHLSVRPSCSLCTSIDLNSVGLLYAANLLIIWAARSKGAYILKQCLALAAVLTGVFAYKIAGPESRIVDMFIRAVGAVMAMKAADLHFTRKREAYPLYKSLVMPKTFKGIAQYAARLTYTMRYEDFNISVIDAERYTTHPMQQALLSSVVLAGLMGIYGAPPNMRVESSLISAFFFITSLHAMFCGLYFVPSFGIPLFQEHFFHTRSLTEFWTINWHGLFTSPIKQLAYAPGHKIGGRALGMCAAMAFSGLYHWFVVGALNEPVLRMRVFLFFVLQGPAILVDILVFGAPKSRKSSKIAEPKQPKTPAQVPNATASGTGKLVQEKQKPFVIQVLRRVYAWSVMLGLAAWVVRSAPSVESTNKDFIWLMWAVLQGRY
ncbi:Man1-Src1p-C-terminal domain-domain-containing protein [Protomyces lactucae-debilis]|uniref:Man1-Src1p-C-terminal domain-domain-containing protein n=1 Tax=Protomyces lactucae-debilis TaxID=2754530 RepID=A0A1Y2FU66_PROLT|nr:Man1-Src1p-C-terminal domain-containing protein [Protomyces lactucae-debilis]ORY87107.1 Man1-Src1p-C-terminal domain-domain-containing protein [Protomyces lactucae-debilis]